MQLQVHYVPVGAPHKIAVKCSIHTHRRTMRRERAITLMEHRKTTLATKEGGKWAHQSLFRIAAKLVIGRLYNAGPVRNAHERLL